MTPILQKCHWNSEIEQSPIYWRQIVAISVHCVKGLSTTSKNLKKLVWQAQMSHSTSSHHTGEVDTAVEVRVQEEDEGRNERRK